MPTLLVKQDSLVEQINNYNIELCEAICYITEVNLMRVHNIDFH